MNQNKGMWTGVIVIVLVAVLALWWLAAHQYIDMSTGFLGGSSQTDDQNATSTATTTSGTDTSAGATSGSKTTVNAGSTGSTSNGAGGSVSVKNETVTQIIAGLTGSTEFKSLLTSTGVGATLSSSGKYTVFVPTDGAFSQLQKGTITTMTAAQKKRLVQYHIVSGRALDLDAVVAGGLQALSGDMLNISFGANKIPMVNSAIKITEYDGKNGIVYVMDNVLLPPQKAPGTI